MRMGQLPPIRRFEVHLHPNSNFNDPAKAIDVGADVMRLKNT
jgi:hypothetical protein